MMKPYLWIGKGDVNAFFGLLIDNLTNFVIFSGLLIGVIKFPKEIVFFRMIPGTAIGVLCGNIIFTYLAFRLMKKTGRGEITARCPLELILCLFLDIPWHYSASICSDKRRRICLAGRHGDIYSFRVY